MSGYLAVPEQRTGGRTWRIRCEACLERGLKRGLGEWVGSLETAQKNADKHNRKYHQGGSS